MEAKTRVKDMLRITSDPPPGKLVAIVFLRVDRDSGEDVYRVEYEHRIFDWFLQVNSDGKIANAWLWNVPK